VLRENNKAGRAPTLAELFQADPERGRHWLFRFGPLLADLSRRHLDRHRLDSLLSASREAGLTEAVRRLFAGEVVNPTEGRPALHWAWRAPNAELSRIDPEHERDAVRQRMDEIAAAVRGGKWRGTGGGPISDVICLGIGGSELGPRLAVEALGPGDGPEIHFLANVDGGPIERLLATLDPATTLALITSKSFRTAETMLNAATVRGWLARAAPDERAAEQCLAITARPGHAVDWGIPERNVLPLWESVGGRYSLWSAAGLPVLIALGSVAFDALLAGAAEMDQHFRTESPERNLPILAGSLDAAQAALAVVPYDERLRLLPEYLQQLYMESLGKPAPEGRRWRAPVVFGTTGTRAQHTFFQALHQGELQAAVDFIGVIHADHGLAGHQRALLANLLGQARALALGGGRSELDRTFACPGDRPSNVLLLEALTPRALGALLAHYEHRVFVAATLAGVNPFDQLGVELGKRLAGELEPLLEGGEAPPGLEALLEAIRGA